MSMSREQIVRDTAYAIWEAEGRPDGREGEHWRLAEERVAASLKEPAPKGGIAKPKAPVKGKVEASAAKAVLKATALLKAAATKAAPKKS